MPHQLLDGADVDALLEEVGGEAVPQCVKTRLLGDGSRVDRVTKAALEALFMEVIPVFMRTHSAKRRPLSRENCSKELIRQWSRCLSAGCLGAPAALLGSTTEIYLHMATGANSLGVISPLDQLPRAKADETWRAAT